MGNVRQWAVTVLLSGLFWSGALCAETLVGLVETVDLEGRRLVISGSLYAVDGGRLRVVAGQRQVDPDLLTVGTIVQFQTELDPTSGGVSVVEIELPTSPAESRE